MKHDRDRFFSACRDGSDYVVTDGSKVTVYTAVERPLDQASARAFVLWANRSGVEGIVLRSNFLHLRLGERVSLKEILEQLELCRNLPLTEGMAEVIDRSGLWPDLPAEAAAFIETNDDKCDVFAHLREPIRNVPKSQFRWVE